MNSPLFENEVGLSRVEQVYRTIRKNILSNHYPPGHQALEPELAKQLGVSRTPVREALIRLESEKLIELIPRRGMRVLPLVPTDFLQVCQVVTALEETAVELLASQRPGKDLLEPMNDALREMRVASGSEDVTEWSEASEKFHRLLSRLCGNARLANLLDTLRAQSYRARQILLKLQSDLKEGNEVYAALLQAISEGEGDKAKEIYCDHRKKVVDESMELLERYSLPHL